ncbi:MAG: dTDP-4-dehydrorhamnose 3,5-epimerase [Flavobacteriaceae bacterium]|jgi:dTDP-4-dehydrorhamnose 3,5-epimerase|nr:dTDP-4-dehydrorhamnose 3,5-epimerase [Flavobacteriaceae bacterium]
MKVTSLKIPDVKLIEPDVFEDERGFLYESFNQKKFNEAIDQEIIFVQDNHSKSSKGVLRGLHYQDPPYAQGKLIRIVAGEVFDVAVDIRKGSPTYGQWLSETLSEGNKKQLWIPEGFAHGFLTLSGEAEFLYKTTNFYSKEHERTIHWKRNDFGIIWPDVTGEIITSNKDAKPS